jgi:hypothetical protein
MDMTRAAVNGSPLCPLQRNEFQRVEHWFNHRYGVSRRDVYLLRDGTRWRVVGLYQAVPTRERRSTNSTTRGRPGRCFNG